MHADFNSNRSFICMQTHGQGVIEFKRVPGSEDLTSTLAGKWEQRRVWAFMH